MAIELNRNIIISDYLLPRKQTSIVQSNIGVVDLIGLKCSAPGTVYIKLEGDTSFFANAVNTGDTIIGKIIGIGSSTTLANSEMVGLQ